MDVDPLKFRLRAFEHNFVKPIRSYLDREPLLVQRALTTPFWHTLVSGAPEPEPLVDHDAPASIGLIQAFLLAEAGEWIRVGRRIGYFSSEAPSIPLTFGETDLLEDHLVIRYASRANDGARWYSTGDVQQDFANDLTAATEQLDDSTGPIELVRLLHFATQQEWARLHGMLEELASTLERRPDVSFSDAVMEELSWAFFEGRLTSFGTGPSSWRNTLRQDDGPIGALTSERFGQLTEVRGRIAAAAERIGSGDGSTASALLASLLQGEQVRRRGPADLPLMFSRVDEQARLRSNHWIMWDWDIG